MRIGVEKGINKNQSFLGLIGDVYFNKHKLRRDKTLNIVENTRKIMLENLNIDKFIYAQNGNLIQLFYKDIDISAESMKSLIQDSIFKNDTNILGEKQTKYIIQSYVNFRNYLSDKSVNINYYYLWDLISEPRKTKGILFEDGVNLIIMNDILDDISNKIEIICPTNHFSHNIFDKQKNSIMMYTKNNTFEPIYEINKKTNKGKRSKMDDKFNIKREFSWNDLDKIVETKNIKNMFEKIIEFYIQECKSKNVDEKYEFKSNIHFDSIKSKLPSDNVIIHYISNSLMQIIGLVVNTNDKNYYLPCAPSSIPVDNTASIINIKDDRVPINNLEDTLLFLKNMSKLYIPCEPSKILTNDKMIVGVLTETNQVVIVEPEVYNKDDIIDDNLDVFDISLPNLKENKKYYELDEELLTDNSIDTERQEVINKINLEDKYYINFRNLFKLLINKVENKTKKKENQTYHRKKTIELS